MISVDVKEFGAVARKTKTRKTKHEVIGHAVGGHAGRGSQEGRSG